jgi:putative two-component system response regulator
MPLTSDHLVKPVILVVDDTPDNLLLMANLLKEKLHRQGRQQRRKGAEDRQRQPAAGPDPA